MVFQMYRKGARYPLRLASECRVCLGTPTEESVEKICKPISGQHPLIRQLRHFTILIYRILSFQRMRQRYAHGVEIHKSHIKDDLHFYVNSLRTEFDYVTHFHIKNVIIPSYLAKGPRRPSLVELMNKIWLNDHLVDMGVNKFYMSFEHPPSAELLSGLTHYVAKPAHLSEGESVFIVSDGKD